MLALSPLFLVLMLGVASRGGAAEDVARSKPTYFQDVKPILEGRCTGCHYRGGIAPFPLTTYGAARLHRAEVASAVRRRLMPPWRADSRYRRYLYDPSLTGAQIATIARWAATGGPKGDPARAAPPLPSVAPHLSRVNARLAMPSAYTPRRRSGGDDYRCFVLPWTANRAQYVTGFNVQPGQRREVHHMILFMASPAEASTVDSWEAADRRPGYSCYGGPSLTGGQEIVAQFLAGWVPGSFGTDFPSGTGIRILPGSRLILQVHYNLESTRPRPDRSVVELKLDDTVAKRAIYMPLVNFAWVISPPTFQIPAGRRNIVHTFSADPRQVVPFLDRELDVSRGVVVHSALLHMHRLGRSGQIAVQRLGARAVLLAIRRWAFDWQREYYFAEPETIAPGERLSIRCVHDNSRRGQPLINGRRRRPRMVTWGENSSDEMCIGFLYVSER
jgi:Copper type II ascorbate-dependent monooxygenase, N-terminal domain/Copper type II ascorbate-dependent monooxygenase, C-terminal domain